MGDEDKDLGVQGMAEGDVVHCQVGGRRVDMKVVSFGIQWRVDVCMYNGIAGTGGVLQMEHVAVQLVQERSEEERSGNCVQRWRNKKGTIIARRHISSMTSGYM